MRRGKGITILLTVLVVLGLAADRGGQLALERLAASRIQDAVATPTRPQVDLGGFPFLGELFSRRFSDVTVELTQADGGTLRVARVRAELHGVRERGGGVHAESVSGEGLISYAALSAAVAPLRAAFGGTGLVAVTTEVKVLGRELTASAAGRPRIEGNVLVVKPERAATSVGAGARTAAVPEIRIALRDIPANLTIVLLPGPDGIRFTFTGRDVQLVSADSTSPSS